MRLEVALDDVIVRAVNVIILHTWGAQLEVGLDDVIVRVEKFP